MARRLENAVAVRDHGRLGAWPLDALLRGLAEIEANDIGVVSLYLDARWGDEQQRERARLTVRNRLAEERAQLAARNDPGSPFQLHRSAALERAETYATAVIRQRLDVGFEGIAAFFAPQRLLDLAVLTHAPMPTGVRLGPRPYLAPLVRCASDFELALIAVVETDETRILEISLGGLLNQEQLEGDVPDRVQRGGWAQGRIQRHISDHVLHHHREGAHALMTVFDRMTAMRGQPPRVVIGGHEPLLSSFERHVPDRILRRALRTTRLDPSLGDAEILAIVHELLDDEHRRADREALAQAREAAASGRGAVELQGVLAGLNMGRVRELYVERRFERPGWACTRCDQLLATEAPACPACGGALAHVSLLEELVRRAVLAGAAVRTVDAFGESRRDDWIGVAATFRY